MRIYCFFLFGIFSYFSTPLGAQVSPSLLGIPSEIDATVQVLMEKNQIPGAVVVVVLDSSIIYKSGFGFADLDQQTPVDPDSTLFRLASVSKLFTATAVMQLYEQGKLDLEEELRPEFPGKPKLTLPPGFTIKNLLSHTAGYDETYVEMASIKREEILSLQSYNHRNQPKKVRTANEVISYSNYSYALAGYMVELASKENFNVYVSKHIFSPLGMTSSSMGPPILDDHVASSYSLKNGKPFAYQRDYLINTPAAGLHSTGNDMAKFMIAHLNQGAGILKPETTALMHSVQFRHHPDFDGWCYGFFEDTYKDQRIIKHDGWWQGFRSSLVLVPEIKLGIFVSQNQKVGTELYNKLNSIILDKFLQDSIGVFFPLQARAEPDLTVQKTLEGTYRHVRHSKNSYYKLAVLSGDVREVKPSFDEQGQMIYMGEPYFQSKDPYLYHPLNARSEAALRKESIYFKRDETGKVQYLTRGKSAFVRISPLNTRMAHIKTILPAALILLISPFVFLVAFKRSFGTVRTARNMALAQSIIAIGFLIFLAYKMLNTETFDIFLTISQGLRALLSVPYLLLLLMGPLFFHLAKAWRDKYWGLTGRIYYSLFFISLLVFLRFIWCWHVFI